MRKLKEGEKLEYIVSTQLRKADYLYFIEYLEKNGDNGSRLLRYLIHKYLLEKTGRGLTF